MLDWLTPQTIEVLGTKKVVKYQGKLKVYVDGTEQSGPWVRKIWSKVPLPGHTVLILGLGCGVVTDLLDPQATITGVELDPDMVTLGKKYFTLSPKVKVIIGDAAKFIATTPSIFDLILVDLYQGSHFPEQFASSEFLKKLSQTVSNTGTVIFNRLTTQNAHFEASEFVDNLEKYFKIQKTVRIDFNILFICSRRLA